MADGETRLLMLIDDEPVQSRLVGAVAAREGWRTLVAESADEALAKLDTPEGRSLGAVLLDQWVPGDDACNLIREIKTRRPTLPVLMITASTSPLLAVEAMRAGATDYLIKPVAGERLLLALRSATRPEPPRFELQPLAEKLVGTLDFDTMVGTAPPFRTALAKAATAARGHAHALVEGETGTGKEMLLRAMHSASPRAKLEMRAISIGGTTAGSIESLLFGHEKGAFPGAFDRQVGLFESCDGGTLILDEIDRLDPLIQVRLAETLETGIVRPTGAKHGFRVDIRVLAASDRPLAPLVEAGQFSSDLYEQLGAAHIVLPPLRERAGDIPALTRFFLSRIGQQPGLRHHSIADSGLHLLEAYDWPGNVRQLQAVLFRAAVFSEQEALTADSFPQLSELLGDMEDRTESRQRGLGVMLYTDDGNLRPLEEIEADVIRLAIGHYRGRMTEVARRLGIGRSTLYRKLADLGIDNAA
ncbi:sigma-54-dependent Fis family transcriptional regulator [Erythrobacter sp. HI0063]|jgi:DNA-binding NtrC family response regulator|uniref:sigma-54-dependent transcriptional regulator n=1 Tax=Erythrobacter sp. HI0063 TaxID=1822240 RepID=UPI0007C3F834|nr:sigma-54 dependent transcriptional regulator [Erythrobacter sp. HI0063]KZY55131.1 sigma-54-dependent Fis family transcriptional regulator [Erythrobacter sp. HI0063]